MKRGAPERGSNGIAYAKIPNSLYHGGGGGGTNFQLLMPSQNLLKSQKSHYGGRGGGGVTNFQLLMRSPNLLKSRIPYMGGWVGGWWGGGSWVQTNF